MHDFCKCGTQEELESRRKGLNSNVFIKVRFSLSRHCNKYLLWSLTVSYQAGQTPARKRKRCGINTPSGVHGMALGSVHLVSRKENCKPVKKKRNIKPKRKVKWCFVYSPPFATTSLSPNVYTIAFVYLLSYLQDKCSGIMMIQSRLCILVWKWCSESMRKL